LSAASSSIVRSAAIESRVQRQYKEGKFFSNLIKKREDASKLGIGGKDIDEILVRIQRAKRQIGGDIRADRNGVLYKFDQVYGPILRRVGFIIKESVFQEFTMNSQGVNPFKALSRLEKL
jgi:hypothetical protein